MSSFRFRWRGAYWWCSVAIVFLAFLWSACGPDDGQPVAGARREMLHATVEVVILPTYRDLVDHTVHLAMAAEMLQAEPSASSLAAARDAWRAARQAWKRSEAFRFGPSEDVNLRLANKIDWVPTNPARIEEEIAGGAELTQEYIESIGVTRRGFAALEYLLFDDEAAEGATLARLVNEERARDYVTALANDLVWQSRKLLSSWEASGDDFGGELFTAGQGSVAYPTVKEALDDLVGAFVFLSATLQEKRLGAPAGIVPPGPPRPDLVELTRSDSALVDIADNVQSLAATYRCDYAGHFGLSIGALVAGVSPEIDKAIQHALDRARYEVSRIRPPLTTALTDDPASVERAYEALRALRAALAVDLASAVGATPRFVGDGD